jgi:general secretion pathway protein J
MPPASRRTGFTLMELMVAIFVIGMVFTIIWSTFSRTVESKKMVEDGNEMYHQLRWAMDKIALDLSSAYVSTGKNNYSQFVAVSQNINGIPQDLLHFTSFSHVRYSADEKSSDQCELSYFVVPDPTQEGNVLFRREDFTVDDSLTTGGEVLDLVEGILAFNLKFYNGEEWVDDWDSRTLAQLEEQLAESDIEQTDEMMAQIPLAVEIAMSMADESGQEVFLTTKVKLPLSSIDLKLTDDEDDEDSDKGSSSNSSGSSGTNSSGSGSSSSGSSAKGGYLGAG